MVSSGHRCCRVQTSDSLISRVTHVTESVEEQLQLENRLTPALECYVDIQPVLTAVNSMQLLQMKGIPRYVWFVQSSVSVS